MLLEYQTAHAAALNKYLDTMHCVLDSSDTGTGKTYTTAHICAMRKMPVFVVCLKSAIPTWFDVLTSCGVQILGIANYDLLHNDKFYVNKTDFFAEKPTPCLWFQNQTWNLHDAMLVFDEAHKSKNSITINSKIMTAARELYAQGCKIMILSATITDSLENFHMAAYMLGICQYGKHAFSLWIKKLQQTRPDDPITTILHDIIYNKCASRMRINDVKKNTDMFRANDIQAVVCDISPQIEEKLEREYAKINALMVGPDDVDCVLVKLLRARQRIELLKIDVMVLTAMEFLLNGNSVVVFVNFNESAKIIIEQLQDFVRREFDSIVMHIHGAQSAHARNSCIAAFQADECRVIVCNIKAGSNSISLHDVCGNFPRASIVSPPWSCTDLKQALGRIYRANAKSDAVQRIIYCAGKTKNDKPCVEELVARNLNAKLLNIELLNNGDYLDLLKI